jgi:uridine phosphorylase
VNIDLETRTIKSELTTLNIIRVGTSGSLQKDIPVDSYVVSTHGLGIDNLLNFYRYDHNDEDKQLLHSFITQTQLHNNISYPYINSCAPSLMKHFVNDFYHGVTVTCPGFYGPQGRILRLGLNNPALIDRLSEFSFGQHRITNFEMETAAIYGLGKLLGHYCLSLSAIVANRVHRNFSPDANAAVEKLIEKTLGIIAGS